MFYYKSCEAIPIDVGTRWWTEIVLSLCLQSQLGSDSLCNEGCQVKTKAYGILLESMQGDNNLRTQKIASN